MLGPKVLGLLSAAALTGSALVAPTSSGTIAGLHQIQVVASTVNLENQDGNPYGLTMDTFAGTETSPNPYYGDLLISNFSNAAGINGAGTTIEAINPTTGTVTTLSHAASGPVALAVSPKGPIWIANFGTKGTNGNVQVLKPNGAEFPNGGSIISTSALHGPWGQVFVPATVPAFLVANALNGTIEAMYDFAPPHFNTDTQFKTIGAGLAHSGLTAANVQGPQGMVYDPATKMIYITDTADNSIRAYFWNGPSTPNQGTGQLIYQGGPLAGPVGITRDPLNGDLLVVNSLRNTLVELALNPMPPTSPVAAVHSIRQSRMIGPFNPVPPATPVGEHAPQSLMRAHVVAVKTLDRTPVNPMTGAGSALFGVYATRNAQGHLLVYFTDDNTNTVDVLK